MLLPGIHRSQLGGVLGRGTPLVGGGNAAGHLSGGAGHPDLDDVGVDDGVVQGGLEELVGLGLGRRRYGHYQASK